MENVDVNGIMFYASYYKAIARIPDDTLRLQAYDVVCGYMMTGEIPDNIDWQIESIFDGLKPNIDTSRKNSKNGAKNGGKKSKTKANEEPNESQTETNEKPNESQTETKREQIEREIEKEREREREIEKPIARARTPSDARFEIFWQTYPKKVDKVKAEKAFQEANIDAELFDRIIKAIGEAKESEQWTKDGGQYIPNPANWLAQKRWNDELPKRKTRANFKQRDRTGDDFAQIELQLLQKRREA